MKTVKRNNANPNEAATVKWRSLTRDRSSLMPTNRAASRSKLTTNLIVSTIGRCLCGLWGCHHVDVLAALMADATLVFGDHFAGHLRPRVLLLHPSPSPTSHIGERHRRGPVNRFC